MGLTGAGSNAYAQEAEFTRGNTGTVPAVVGPPALAIYDAQAITGLADGAAMTTWADTSGNGYTLANTNGNPLYYSSTAANLINGHPAVKFTGAPYFTAAGFPVVNQPFTVITVLQNPSLAVWGSGTSSADVRLLIFNNTYNMYAGSTVSGGTPDSTAHVVTVTLDGASSVLRVDGGQVAAGNPGPNSTTAGEWHVGQDFNVASDWYTGLIGELRVYENMAPADVTTVEGILKSRWGTP